MIIGPITAHMAASTSPQEGNAWSCKVPYHAIELQIPVQDILKIWLFVTQAVKLDDTGTEIYRMKPTAAA